MDGCTKCQAYEVAVMNRGPDEPEPAPPCDHYQMSDEFQTWIVDAMRSEVMGQVSMTGLDRLAIVKGEEE